MNWISYILCLISYLTFLYYLKNKVKGTMVLNILMIIYFVNITIEYL